MKDLRLNLARKYRPQRLEDLCGQDSAVRILQEALKANRIAPAYLFSGPRGVGKTSSARIFAKAASCLSAKPDERPCGKCRSCEAVAKGKMMDILEIDGASHTGVDDVRSIIESVAYRPSIGARNVYIVDEVHMLSNAAFNALLKTLEEPPPHALFLFATTEPEKIPATILSRVQRLELQRLKDREVLENLQSICKNEQIKISLHTLEQIAIAADGSLRDGQTLLEQMILLSASTDISEEIVDAFLGTIGSQQELHLMKLISEQNAFGILERVHHFFDKGKDLTKLLSRLLHWTRCLLLSKAADSTHLFEKECPPESLEKLLSDYKTWSIEDLDRLFEVLWAGYEKLRRTDLPKIAVETCLIRCCRIPKTMDLAKLMEYAEASATAVPTPAPEISNAKSAFSPIADKGPATTKSAAPTKAADPGKPAETWDEVLLGLKRKRPSLLALIQCASETKFKLPNLSLSFPSSHFAYRQLSDPLMLKDFEKALEDVCKTKVSVQLEESDKSSKAVPPPKTNLIKEAKRQIVEDPEIQKATQILQGKISQVTIEGIKT